MFIFLTCVTDIVVKIIPYMCKCMNHQLVELQKEREENQCNDLVLFQCLFFEQWRTFATIYCTANFNSGFP